MFSTGWCCVSRRNAMPEQLKPFALKNRLRYLIREFEVYYKDSGLSRRMTICRCQWTNLPFR